MQLFRNRVSNLGLVTQNVQWLIMQGSFFVISVFLQQVRGYSAIETGLMLTPTTIGILVSSALAGRLAKRRPQRFLIWSGFRHDHWDGPAASRWRAPRHRSSRSCRDCC